MNDIKDISVSSEVLLWARENLALTQNNAVERIGISLHRLKQLESGEKKPTLDELKSMSKTYKRTIATLLLKTPPKEKPLPKDRRTVDSKKLDHFNEKTILAVRKARALTDALLELRKENQISVDRFNVESILGISDITLKTNAKEISKQLRLKMDLEQVSQYDNVQLALDAYIELVEKLGIAVFQLSLTKDDLRGFSLIDEKIPVIVIKRGDQSTGKIFTLFHELGHLVLTDSGMCNISYDLNSQQIEKWCNAFAGEMLIPSEKLLTNKRVLFHIQHNKREWTKRDLIEIGSMFHVGPLALLRSLLENNLTNPSFYDEKHQKWNKPTFGRSKEPKGRNIPKETINEKGKTYISLAFNAFDQNRIDLKDLSDFLGVRIPYISKTRELLYSS